MSNYLIQRAAALLPPEIAHNLAIEALAAGAMPLPAVKEYPELSCRALGFDFANPIGLAAGFDKNGDAYPALLKGGFGFVEIGTITPRRQKGNPKPRLFRLKEDRAVINRMGFNNEGADDLAARLPVREKLPGIVGINIGCNKDSADAYADYSALLDRFYARASYFTVNVSSPNTPGLRDLQKKEPLAALIGGLMRQRRGLAAMQSVSVPLLVKIAPDLSEEELADIVEIALGEGVDGLIVSNTTIARPAALHSAQATEAGGLSGQPLFVPSTEMLKRVRRLAGKEMMLIGAGGVATAEQALAKIRAGADLVQLYTALVYEGFGLVERIKADMVKRLRQEGIASVREWRDADL